ncbi:16946_t:CDS:2, partial [Gigaspora rosea]
RKNKDPSLSIDQLSAEYSCDRSTISKILKEKNKWLAIQMTEPQERKKTNRAAKFEELENAMNIWMRRVLSQNGILTDGILQAWDSVTPRTIINCWKKTQIVPSSEWSRSNWNVEDIEAILDEAAILEEIFPQSDSDSSSNESVIEIEKISHSVALEQCRLLMQYVEQQDPIKFVEGQDLTQLR